MLTMWDVGGQATKLWKHYFDKIDAIIYAIDATADAPLLQKNRVELSKVCKDKALENVPVILMINKVDLLPDGFDEEKLIKSIKLALDIEDLPGRKSCHQLCSAKSSVGVWEGLQQLAEVLETGSNQ